LQPRIVCLLWMHLMPHRIVASRDFIFFTHIVRSMRWDEQYITRDQGGEKKRELRWPVLFLEWEVLVIGGEMPKWAKHLIESYTTKSFKTKKHKIGLQGKKVPVGNEILCDRSSRGKPRERDKSNTRTLGRKAEWLIDLHPLLPHQRFFTFIFAYSTN
jgi:hypothetical protein